MDCVVIHLLVLVLFPWAILAGLLNQGTELQTKSYHENYFFLPLGTEFIVTLPYVALLCLFLHDKGCFQVMY